MREASRGRLVTDATAGIDKRIGEKHPDTIAVIIVDRAFVFRLNLSSFLTCEFWVSRRPPRFQKIPGL